MSTAIHETTSLSLIPDNIGLNYLSEVSLKKKLKAQGFISGSYFSKVVFCKKDQETVDAVGFVYPSQRKRDKPHQPVVTINLTAKRLDDAHCSCQAGLKTDGSCSHGVALLLLLERWKLAGYKKVPDMLTCTSLPQQWDKPRGDRIMAEPVATMIIAKPGNTNRKRKPVMATFTDNRKIHVNDSDIEALQALDGSPISYLVEQSNNFESTQYGNVPTGAALGYHAPLIVPLYEPRQEQGCGDLHFPYTTHISNDCLQLLAAHEHEWSHLSLSLENAQSLERSTVSQVQSTQWLAERSKRIPASTFGQIMTRKKSINASFMSNTFAKGQFHSKATSYGTSNENKAKMMYINKEGVHLHQVGLLVNPQFAFIGATPDAILCKDGKSCIMEVKCPYSARDLTIPEAIHEIKDFFLVSDATEIKLKQNHKHYYQVQGQLLVSGAKECHFITYTRKDFHCQVIHPNEKVMEDMLQTIVHFYISHFKPFKTKSA